MTNWTVQTSPLYAVIQTPDEEPAQQIILFLHGWTGDENSMQIFSQVAPPSSVKIFLRGHLPAPTGFGWAPPRQGVWIDMDKFKPASGLILQTLEHIRKKFPEMVQKPIVPIGFSQGGAMALALLYYYPEEIFQAAVLSGFLPKISILDVSFTDKSIFLSHGTKDEIIPVEMARESVKILTQAGARVHYCESSTGHKTSAECLKRLRAFLEENLHSP